MKKCGNCVFFVKLKKLKSIDIPGLCEKHDWGCSENYGKRCQDHKPLKYNRVKAKAL